MIIAVAKEIAQPPARPYFADVGSAAPKDIARLMPMAKPIRPSR